MYGLLDVQSRNAYARERAETLREVMQASRRSARATQVAGRRAPARLLTLPRARTHRPAV